MVRCREPSSSRSYALGFASVALPLINQAVGLIAIAKSPIDRQLESSVRIEFAQPHPHKSGKLCPIACQRPIGAGVQHRCTLRHVADALAEAEAMPIAVGQDERR